MSAAFAFRRMDADERRHDGPIPPADPAAPPSGVGRALLFQRLAAEQREDLSRRRRNLSAAGLAGDAMLHRGQGYLRFYRDQGAAWAALRPR